MHAAKIFGEEDVTDATFVIEPKAARLAVLLARPTLRSIYLPHPNTTSTSLQVRSLLLGHKLLSYSAPERVGRGPSKEQR